jgi:hypothetical protein
MTEPEPGAHRRRRRRATSAQGAPPTAPVPGPRSAPGGGTQPHPAAQQADGPAKPERRRGTQSARDSGERGLRDLVGAGHSQLGVSGALRGRDVNRPTEEDLAEAEREVQVVRRHWTPPAERA